MLCQVWAAFVDNFGYVVAALRATSSNPKLSLNL